MRKLTAVFLAFVVLIATTAPAQAAKGKKSQRTPEQVFKRLDTNRDGALSLAELVGKRTDEKAIKAEQAFKRLDKDGDGSVTLSEFRAHNAGKKKAKSL
ncbi:MAG: EF-hand domain-containing protein [Planctomycetia bacterium]|nr:EF-hand domain-containing protein [Planctomycetia bacterium]